MTPAQPTSMTSEVASADTSEGTVPCKDVVTTGMGPAGPSGQAQPAGILHVTL